MFLCEDQVSIVKVRTITKIQHYVFSMIQCLPENPELPDVSIDPAVLPTNLLDGQMVSSDVFELPQQLKALTEKVTMLSSRFSRIDFTVPQVFEFLRKFCRKLGPVYKPS
jgi:hypothetical protein